MEKIRFEEWFDDDEVRLTNGVWLIKIPNSDNNWADEEGGIWFESLEDGEFFVKVGTKKQNLSRDETKLIELFKKSETVYPLWRQLNRVCFRATRKLDVDNFQSVMLFRDALVGKFEELKNSDRREISEEVIHLIKVICKLANE